MAAVTRSPQEMAGTLKRLAWAVLATAMALLVAVVVLTVGDRAPGLRLALWVVFFLDLCLALALNLLARRTSAATKES